MENGTMPLRATFLPNIKKDKYKINSFEFKKWQFIPEGETLFIFEDKYKYVAQHDCICNRSELWGMYSETEKEFLYGDPLSGLYFFTIHGGYEFKVFQAIIHEFSTQNGYALNDDLAFQRMLEQSKIIVKAFCLDFEENIKIELPYITGGCKFFEFDMSRSEFLSLVKTKNCELLETQST
jgi:hypothetical protein